MKTLPPELCTTGFATLFQLMTVEYVLAVVLADQALGDVVAAFLPRNCTSYDVPEVSPVIV